MEKSSILKAGDTISDMWIGFCLGWIWFTDDSFWKILAYEVLVLALIIIGSHVINNIVRKRV